MTTNDFKTGMTIDLDGDLLTVLEFQHVKPGKGGAFVRTTLRNVRTGSVVDRRFNAGERIERAFIEKREQQFLYRDGTDFVVMDNESFEQSTVSETAMADAAKFITEGSAVVLLKFGDEVIGTELPASVELAIMETEPGVQGDRVSGARKPATLETGHVVQVPLFVGPDDRIKVDTRTGEYITRA
jgi:elongation factor P